MAKVGADAAIRDYIVKPRLEYRTLQGVNGPLVILEVRRGSRLLQSLRHSRHSACRCRHLTNCSQSRGACSRH